MIILAPITDPTKLQEYYRFRYRIYNESRLKGFVADADGIDKDAYDDRAWHFGWYVDGKLVGCIRFIEPDASETPIPMLSYVTDDGANKVVRAYIAERNAKGQRMIEASRFCLAPEQRGLRTAREFVLAMVMTMQPLGFEQGLFDCDRSHARFYRILGFDALAGAEDIMLPGRVIRTTTLVYNYGRLIRRNPDLKASLVFDPEQGARKAA